jgi:hypothetical protein
MARRRWYGTTKQRGYSGQHPRLRKQWQPLVDAGLVSCHALICLKEGRRIQPGEPWDLGHTPDRTGWTGPEHQECNRADGTRRKNSRYRQESPPILLTSRNW